MYGRVWKDEREEGNDVIVINKRNNKIRCLLCQSGPCPFSQRGNNVAFSYSNSLKKLNITCLYVYSKSLLTPACRRETQSRGRLLLMLFDLL